MPRKPLLIALFLTIQFGTLQLSAQVDWSCVPCRGYCSSSTGCPRQGCNGSCCRRPNNGPTQPRDERREKGQSLKQQANEAFQSKNWEEAIKRYEEALEYLPDDGEIQRKLDAARTQLLKEKGRSLKEQGNEAFESKNWEDAIKSYKEALEYLPNDGEIHRKLDATQTQLLIPDSLRNSSEHGSGLDFRPTGPSNRSSPELDFEVEHTDSTVRDGGRLDFDPVSGERGRSGSWPNPDPRKALENAKAIRAALSKGDKPPFEPVLELYGYNRQIALNMVGENESRCAIVLSMTLGITPNGSGDASVHVLPKNQVTDAEIAKRYYLRAHELAHRLISERQWGRPLYLDGAKARQSITGKRGILYIEHAYLTKTTYKEFPTGWKFGDHIDLWDRDHFASDAGTPFEPAREDPWWSFAPQEAREVWFWEIPQNE